jgi:hypothetical protein
MTYPFRILKHFPELIPSIIDIVAMVLLTKLFNLGNGYAGGIAGLFASNILSIIIFMHTHHGKREEVEYVSH